MFGKHINCEKNKVEGKKMALYTPMQNTLPIRLKWTTSRKKVRLSGGRAHYVMVSKFQWQPFWLATQLYPQNDWTGWPYGVSYDVYAQASLQFKGQVCFTCFCDIYCADTLWPLQLHTSDIQWDDSWFTRGTTWQTRGLDERETKEKDRDQERKNMATDTMVLSHLRWIHTCTYTDKTQTPQFHTKLTILRHFAHMISVSICSLQFRRLCIVLWYKDIWLSW